MKILVVDDDPAVLRLMRRLLTEEGHSLREASRAEEALELIGEELPELIFCDNKMPGMSGLELLKLVRQKYDVPFVLVTGYAEMEVAVEALNSGAFYFIHKPVNIYEIKAVIERQQERLELRRKLEEQHGKRGQLSRLG